MRKYFRSLGVGHLGMGLALGCVLGPSIALLATSASAESCQLGDIYRENAGPRENPPSNTAARTGNDVTSAVSPNYSSDYSSDRTERVVAGICDASKGLGLQAGITVLGATGLTGAIMGRLDASRGAGVAMPSGVGSSDGMMGLGMPAKKAGAAPAGGLFGPWTVYATGTLLAGDSRDMPTAAGFSYSADSGMLGVEYSAGRNLILGAAASVTRMDTDLNTGATTDADVIHGAAYLSYATRLWFVDALVTYGVADLDMSRMGAVDTVHGSTESGALGLALRGAYLFEVGKVRVGPIAGLTYVGAKVDGYTERGNDPTAMTVDGQTVESLTGSAGIRFLAPFQAGGGLLVVSYLNVTLEHQFGDGTGDLTTSLAQTPGAPVSLSFPIFDARDYGKVEGGVTVELAPEASISISGASTFARDDGHDYRISAGLNYRF